MCLMSHGKIFSNSWLFPQFFSASFFFVLIIVYFWFFWVFVIACGVSLFVVSGVYSSLRSTSFSLQGLLLLWSTGCRHVDFSSCGPQAQVFYGMLDLPGPGVEPMSLVLAGGFLSTVPPGKSSVPLYLLFYFLAMPHGLHDSSSPTRD